MRKEKFEAMLLLRHRFNLNKLKNMLHHIFLFQSFLMINVFLVSVFYNYQIMKYFMTGITLPHT